MVTMATLSVQKKMVTCDINKICSKLYSILSNPYILYQYISLVKPLWHKRALVLNHASIVAQGQENRNRIDSARSIARVAKESKAELALGKRKERAEGKIEGLERQSEKLLKFIEKNTTELNMASKKLEEQKHTQNKADLEQILRDSKSSSKGTLSVFERRVLINQFEIDLYAEALRRYIRYFEISDEKSAIVSDSDEEFDSVGGH